MKILEVGQLMELKQGHVWSALEYRICAELSEFDEGRWRGWWCDGVVARSDRDEAGRLWIFGDVWLGKDGQTRMDLKMALPASIQSDAQLDWDALVPHPALTGWLRIDEKLKQVHIDTTQGEAI